MTDNRNVDEAWKALADPMLHQWIKRRRSEIQTLSAPMAAFLVARVTVDDETLIVRADKITAALTALTALTALNGEPKAVMRLDARIEVDAMTPAGFPSIPEFNNGTGKDREHSRHATDRVFKMEAMERSRAPVARF